MGKQQSASTNVPVVLVVDDDPAVRNSLKFALEIEGFAVRDYPDGDELLQASDLPHIGCLIIDYNLSDMTGLEVLGQLRERRVSIPAILITSNASQHLRQRAAAAGARVVEKPLLGDALVESIRDILSQPPQPSPKPRRDV